MAGPALHGAIYRTAIPLPAPLLRHFEPDRRSERPNFLGHVAILDQENKDEELLYKLAAKSKE